jgi:hypothetical protein
VQGFACAACVASAVGEWEYSDWRDFVVAAQGASYFVDVEGIGDSFAFAVLAAPACVAGVVVG